MKLSPILLCLFFLMACATKNRIQNPSAVNQIIEQVVYFKNGEKLKLTKNKDNPTIIYLVRHAEKAKEGGKNPLLSTKGEKRAENLKTILLGAGIDAVYSTEYHRTQLTAAPIATALGKKIQSYNPRNLNNFAEQLLAKNKGKQVVVIGHSNTTPALVNALIGEDKLPMIEESEYGHLYGIIINEKRKWRLLDLRY